MNPNQSKRKALEISKLRSFIRMRGDAISTERGYCRWVGKYIDFICASDWQPGVTSRAKIEAFLTAEAERDVSSSTQNGAFYAVLYYYEHVRKEKIDNVDALRAKVGERVRQAPSRDDVRKVLMAVQDSGGYPTRLISHLMYACGSRIGETLAIRIKDIDLDMGKITIIQGKGKRDRFLNIPPILIPQLRDQLAIAESYAAKFRNQGIPIKMPSRYGHKSPKSRFQRRWAWLFPLDHPCQDPRGEGLVTWHCLPGPVRSALALACERTGVEELTPHRLRHAFATHSADAGARLQDIQEILGHKDIKTTMRYIRPDPERVPSPLETLGIFKLKSA
jgi:site-specific recombinase XerD